MRPASLWLAALAGCGALDFDIQKAIPEQTAPGESFSCTLNDFLDRASIAPFTLDIDVAKETNARDTGPARRLELASLVLDVTATKRPAGDTDNFDFLQKLEIFVESAQAGSALPRARVAVLDPVPRGATHLDVTTDRSVDLLPYTNEGAKITSSAKASAPCDDTSFNGLVVVRVMF